MKSTIKFAAIIAVLAGFLMVANPAAAYPYHRHYRHHHHRGSSVAIGVGVGYPGYGYSRPYYSSYYGRPYGYYPRPYYYARPAISIGFGF
jgi:hypothetical protein